MKRSGGMRRVGAKGNHKAKAPTSPMGSSGRVAGPAGSGKGPAVQPINVTGKPQPLGGMAMKTPTFQSLTTDRGAFKIK